METLFAMDFFQDEATLVLSETLSQLREAALLTLNTDGRSDLPYRPYAEIALPSWFFAELPLFPDDDKESELASEMYIGSNRVLSLTRRISTAVHRSGFRRCIDKCLDKIMAKHTQGILAGGPMVASAAALQTAHLGVCGGDLSGMENCMVKKQRQKPRNSASISWETANNEGFVSLWVENNCQATTWKTWNFPMTTEKSSSVPQVKSVFSKIAITLGNALVKGTTASYGQKSGCRSSF